ncbi:hypothetical protein IRZ71_06785 [Flavobacterium sp. ANB]|nr:MULTISPECIES: hypothetical protein [unclassified Flavobacterium]MBF4516039.1 hypothetical protein [Flavobacterium sp. ANB]MTD69041.1 hypothetical protein [Flavobacterium sp. LC2016-13]
MKETFFIAALLFVLNLCFGQKLEDKETKHKIERYIKEVKEVNKKCF